MFTFKKWFTVIEIMIVILIMWLFFVATSQLTHNANIQQTNVDRLTNNIYDSIRNARNNMLIGRWVLSWSNLIATDRRIISISKSGIASTYGSTTNTGIESTLIWPFFDNDSRYQISDISVSSSTMLSGQPITWDYTGVTNMQITVSPSADMTITASKAWSGINTPIKTVRITASYDGFEKSIMLNAPMGKVEVVTWRWERDYTMLPPPTVNSCSASTPACITSGWCTTLSLAPTSVNQAWSLDALSCWFACSPGYSGTNCEIPPVFACSVTLPVCATNTPATCSLVYSPVSIDQAWLKWSATCGFSCTGGYSWPNCTTPPPVVGFTTTWMIGNSDYGNGSKILKFMIMANAWARVDWGDGSAIESLTLEWEVSHTYSISGQYTVKMSGITQFYASWDWWSAPYHWMLISVDDWGGIAWRSMNRMFYWADNLTSLPTWSEASPATLYTPNTSQVTDMSLMFAYASRFNQSLWFLDTTNVTDMRQMFMSASNFNQDLSQWCVSNIHAKPIEFDAGTPSPGFRNNTWRQPQWWQACGS